MALLCDSSQDAAHLGEPRTQIALRQDLDHDVAQAGVGGQDRRAAQDVGVPDMSLIMPPASRTSRMPAATSQGARPISKKAS